MLTVKYIQSLGKETIVPNVDMVTTAKGIVTARFADGVTMTLGPNHTPNTCPSVFVMNEKGATVARYDLPYQGEAVLDEAA